VDAFWKKQIDIRNKILRGEQDAAAARPQVAPLPVHDWFAVAAENAQKAEAERLERERKASDIERARRQAMAQAVQDRQREHGIVRGQLRDKVAECQQQVAAAEAKANSADDAEAQTGILELAVSERRLAAAQREFAMHMSHMP